MKLPTKETFQNKKNLFILFGVLFFIFLLIVSIVSIANNGFNMVPSSSAKSYIPNQVVDVLVNKITSVHKTLPYSYHSLPVCTIKDMEYGNLGDILIGDRIEKMPYDVKFLVNDSCKVLCNRDWSAEDASLVVSRIADDYQADLMLDGLPVVYRTSGVDGKDIYSTKFPLGSYQADPQVTVYNNHINLIVYYNKSAGNDGFNIVYIEVEPRSIDYRDVKKSIKEECASGLTSFKISKQAIKNITWTYSVSFVADTVEWSQRWERYVKLQTGGDVHWFSIVNSILIVAFLTILVAMILVRTLKRDLINYNEEGDDIDETGWKYVAHDVFRKPHNPILLAVLVGSGSQVIAMAILTIILAVLGFLSPSNRGSLLTALILLYVAMGLASGFFTTKVLKMMGIDAWDAVKRASIFNAVFFPGVIFTFVFILNLFLWGNESSSAIPFTTLLGLIFLIIGISVPLSFIGSYIANKQETPKPPTTQSSLPRYIPPQVWYMRPTISILVGGILPFGAVFIELYFILSSIWQGWYYYLYGFLFIVFVILIISCAEISIAMCYFQLCSDDHQWWWRSYATSAATGFYTFLYSIFYLVTKAEITGFTSIVIYLGYSLLMSLCIAVFCGSIGFIACYIFVRKIYSSIHLD